MLLRSRPNSARSPLALLEDADVGQSEGNTDAPDPLSSTWEKEWVAHHYRLALHELQQTFDPQSVQIFQACLAGKTVPELQSMFNMTDQAIYKVRARVKQRLEETIAR